MLAASAGCRVRLLLNNPGAQACSGSSLENEQTEAQRAQQLGLGHTAASRTAEVRLGWQPQTHADIFLCFVSYPLNAGWDPFCGSNLRSVGKFQRIHELGWRGGCHLFILVIFYWKFCVSFMRECDLTQLISSACDLDIDSCPRYLEIHTHSNFKIMGVSGCVM